MRITRRQDGALALATLVAPRGAGPYPGAAAAHCGAGLAAAPRLSGRRIGSGSTLQGKPPSAARLPPGCAFAPRCAEAEDRCRAIDPPPETRDGAMVACHRAPALAEA
jgi:oligopeptide/dipeptide ABC transporter ATP-binding protein